MASVRGRIILVQEGRFQLASTADQDRLFILSHRAPIDAAALHAWARAGRPVAVEYEPADDLIAATALRVTPLPT